MQFFNMDSPFMQGLSKIADLLILNMLALVCCIPVVTAGAALTALNDVVGRMLRDEGTVWSCYWRAFRSNFKQATILWLVVLASGALLVFSLLFYLQIPALWGKILMVAASMLTLLWAVTTAWVFPLQSKFENTIGGTLRNSVLCAIAYLPRSFVMAVLNLLPWGLFLFRLDLFLRLGFLWVGFWLGIVAYINGRLLQKPFGELVERQRSREEVALEEGEEAES